jgi:hypothetical protein
MKRAIKWSKAVKNKYGDLVRTSKCGRYKVVTRTMASARNGCWNAREYDPQKADGTRLGGKHMQESFEFALDIIEYDNNPDWEPDS